MSDFAAPSGASGHSKKSAFADITARLFPSFHLWAFTTSLFLLNAIWLGLSARLSAATIWFPQILLMLVLAVGLTHIAARFEQQSFTLGIKAVRLMIFLLWIAATVNQVRYLNYLTFSLDLPLQDNVLQAMDSSLGFDWLAYSTWIANQKIVLNVIYYAYFGADFFVPGLIAIVSIVFGKGLRAVELARLLSITAFISVLIGAFFPAISATGLHATETLRQLLPSIAGDYHIKEMNLIRSSLPFVLEGQLPGLVTFPSFHTASAIVCMYCSRGTLPGLFAGTSFAIATIMSTPVMGGHYLIDVIAGAVLTGATIMALRRTEKHVG